MSSDVEVDLYTLLLENDELKAQLKLLEKVVVLACRLRRCPDNKFQGILNKLFDETENLEIYLNQNKKKLLGNSH